MTEAHEATNAEKTLLGLGPPEPPREVALEKTDTKDAPVETLRAWSMSRRDRDAFMGRTAGDDRDETLPVGNDHARHRQAFLAVGAIAFCGAFAITTALHGRNAPRPSSHAPSKPAPELTLVAGGPWVLRAHEGVPEASSSEFPAYLRRARASSVPLEPRVPFTPTPRSAGASPPRVGSGASRAKAIPELVSEAPTEDPDRIRAVADSVHLDDEEGPPAAGAADDP